MPEVNKPRAGSRGVWPRKRASRWYPSLRSWVDSEECKPLAFGGWKAGMTQITQKDLRKNSPTKNQLITTPVTVLDVLPLYIFGARSYRKTREDLKSLEEIGVRAEKIPTDLRDRISFSKKEEFEEEEEIDEVRLLVSSQPRRSGLGKKMPEIFEVPLGGTVEEKVEFVDENLGEEIGVDDVFEEGEFLDTVAVTKGKGYQGPVKRYGVKIDRSKDQTPRHIGSMGSRGQGRVMYSAPQPGQDGFHQRTDECKHLLKMGEVEDINPEDGFKNYGTIDGECIILRGSVPGPKKRFVMLRKSIKKREKLPVEIKEIKTGPQQGV